MSDQAKVDNVIGRGFFFELVLDLDILVIFDEFEFVGVVGSLYATDELSAGFDTRPFGSMCSFPFSLLPGNLHLGTEV